MYPSIFGEISLETCFSESIYVIQPVWKGELALATICAPQISVTGKYVDFCDYTVLVFPIIHLSNSQNRTKWKDNG